MRTAAPMSSTGIGRPIRTSNEEERVALILTSEDLKEGDFLGQVNVLSQAHGFDCKGRNLPQPARHGAPPAIRQARMGRPAHNKPRLPRGI